MKTKLLVTLFLVGATSQLQAARPSLGELQQKVDALADALLVCPSHSGPRFVDNGDGTICDHQTGLMWEKKTGDNGFASTGVFDLPTDVDNIYTWTDSNTSNKNLPTGTVFTQFLSQLNGKFAFNASSTSRAQLGGYSDWRLPTIEEFKTITNFSGTVKDPVFEPMHGTYFSSTLTDRVGGVWVRRISRFASFGVVPVTSTFTTQERSAIAVRGRTR